DLCALDIQKSVPAPAPGGGDLHTQPGFRSALDALGVPAAEQQKTVDQAVDALRNSKNQAFKAALRKLPDFVGQDPTWQNTNLPETAPGLAAGKTDDASLQTLLVQQVLLFPVDTPAPAIPPTPAERGQLLDERLNDLSPAFQEVNDLAKDLAVQA